MTGVTAILHQGNQTKSVSGYPYGKADQGSNPGIDTVVPAAWFALNGNGEMTGAHCIEELGILEGPIMLTNTLAVGTVRNAVIHYAYAHRSWTKLAGRYGNRPYKIWNRTVSFDE